MPNVEPWIQNEVKRYDPNLDVVWGCSSKAVKVMGDPIPRFIVMCHTRQGDEVVMILQDKNKDFIQPHPNVILYGNKHLGIQGLAVRDFTKNGGWKKWFEGLHQNEVEYAKHRRQMMKDKNDAFARDIWNSSLMHPRVFVESPLYKEKNVASK